jgi:RNA polymerase sigma-70 factor (ECF subfamily)
VSLPADEELLAAHLRGDSDAFAQLVSRHERRVYGICLRMLGNREDAQDAAQEAFLSALRRASSFRQEAAFSTWLYRIAVNAATDQARRRGRVRTTPLEPEDPGGQVVASGPGDPGDTVATAVTVQAALTKVPEEFRAAVVLCDLLRLPYAEAAAALGVPVGTVKSRVYRGRLALAAELRGAPEQRPGGRPPNLSEVGRSRAPAGLRSDEGAPGDEGATREAGAPSGGGPPKRLNEAGPPERLNEAPGTAALARASEPVEAEERPRHPSKE